MTWLRQRVADRLIERAVGLSLDGREMASKRSPNASDYDAESQVLWMADRLSGLSIWLAAKLVRK